MVKLLHQLEREQDRVYALTGKLMAAVVDARIERNLSPTIAKTIRSAIANAAVDLSSAQAHTADAHRVLETLGKSMGIDPAMFGDGSKDPESESARFFRRG